MDDKNTLCESMTAKYLALILLFLPVFCLSQTQTELSNLAKLSARGDQSALAKLTSYAEKDKDAAKLIGVLYFKGRGVEKNQDKGLSFLEKSAILGDSESRKFLLKIYTDKSNKYFNLEKANRFKENFSQPDSEAPEKNEEKLSEAVRWKPFVEPNYKSKSGGSSFAVNPNGVFVTNQHVVEGCSELVVSYNGKKSYAKLIANSREKDLAIITVDQKTPYFLRLKNQSVSIGEKISVAGYPIIVGFKYSDGIVAAIPRKNEIIQVSASVSSGNSGGPVVDKHGSLVGVIRSVISPGRNELGNVGSDYNFAIDVSALKVLLNSNSISFIEMKDLPETSPKLIVRLLEKTTAEIYCY